MFAIRYAPRLILDARGDDAPEGQRAFQQTVEYRTWHATLLESVQQAVNDLYYGKPVLGIEDEKGNIKVDVVQLHVELTKAQNQMAKFKALGFGPKRSRQVAVRMVKYDG